MSEEIKKIWGDIYSWKCTECGRELRSLYEAQLKSNVRDHKRTH